MEIICALFSEALVNRAQQGPILTTVQKLLFHSYIYIYVHKNTLTFKRLGHCLYVQLDVVQG